MKRHESMRGYFAYELYLHMQNNKDIILLTGDLGYGMFDSIRKDLPGQFINTGAAEQAMMGIAVGLALEGKIPFVYSITPFLIYRAFETIRTYINHESIPVKLVGSGRDKDYIHDGFSHDASDVKQILDTLPNIKTYFPEEKEHIPALLDYMVKNKYPEFISLRR